MLTGRLLTATAFLTHAIPATVPAQCFDLPDYAQAPHVESTLTLPMVPEDVKVQGNLAYVSGSSGIFVVDISDASRPIILGSTALANWPLGIAVSGSLVYAADQDSGLTVVDVSDPSAPAVVGRLVLASMAMDVEVRGALAYVASYAAGLHIVDVSTPTAPVLVGSVATQFVALNLDLQGNYAYVADGFPGLHVVDIADSSQPVIVGTVAPLGAFEEGVVSGAYAYCADHESGFTVVDVSDPTAPFIVGNLDTDQTLGVAVDGSVAYAGEEHGLGLLAIDVSNPAQPALITSFPVMAVDVNLSQNLALASRQDGSLVILDVSHLMGVDRSGRALLLGAARRQHVAGASVYVAAGGSVKRVDVSLPSSPAVVATGSVPGQARDVLASGSSVLAAYSDGALGGGVQILNAPGLGARGNLPLPAAAYGIAESNGIAHVASGEDGLRTVDVSDPDLPLPLGVADTPGQALDVVLAAGHALVADGPGGLQVVDVSDPLAPFVRTSLPLSEPAALALSGDVLHAAGPGLALVDVTDVTAPTLLATFATFGEAADVSVSGNFAYVATNFGFEVLDVEDPTDPHRVGMAFTDAAAGISATPDQVFLSADTFLDEYGAQCPVTATSAAAARPELPSLFHLHESRPNPVAGAAEIVFRIPWASSVRLGIHDVHGRLVRALSEGSLPAGRHRVRWDGRGRDGSPVASGVYVLRLEAGEVRLSRKLTVVR